MQEYPIPGNDEWKREVTRLRTQDVKDFDNLPKRFVRKVSIPANSGDVTANNKVGDFAFEAGFLYVLVDDSGNVKWQRATLSDF